MILQALKEYYDNKKFAKPDEFSIEGYAKSKIPFLIIIKPDGTFVNLEDTRSEKKIEFTAPKTREKKTKIVYEPAEFWLPQPIPRSGSKSYQTVFFLWDHIGYVLGYPESDEKSPKQHQVWLDSLHNLHATLKEDEGIASMILFYEKGEIEKVKKHSAWNDCAKIKSCNIAFQLIGDSNPVPSRDAVKNFVLHEAEKSGSEINAQSICLISGKSAETVRTFQAISLGGEVVKIVSFQKSSGYDSYGKEQGANAPISKKAESAYTSALKMLLASEQRIAINSTTFIFWSETPDPFEQQVADVMSYDPDRRTGAVKALLSSPRKGSYVEDRQKRRFCILGLSPNKARIIVQYWKCTTIAEAAKNIREYFKLIEIYHGETEHPPLSIKHILRELAPGKTIDQKNKNISATNERDYIRSVFEGLAFPESLLQAAIRRNRAEQEVTYPRAAIIKACLNKKCKNDNPNNENHKFKELDVSLDKDNKNIGYLLGRLFFMLLCAQKAAETGGNKITDIKDAYYGAASSTPSLVFPTLMRKLQHHLSKIAKSDNKKWLGEHCNRIILEILDKISGKEGEAIFPEHLSLDNQGCFAIGYYHQVQDFYRKKDKTEETPVETTSE